MLYSTKRYVARGLLALGFFVAANSAWAEAGRVMFVSGEAALIRGGSLPIMKGMPVEAGDTITTGADGRVQLLMGDGDRIALRPNSRFSIDEFSGPSRSKPGEPVAGTRPSSWKSFYTLAKGGFRTLTQSLGQRDASSYQVRTPVATIGIRGTDYSVHFGEENCQGELADDTDGCLVAGVSAGEIKLYNDKGEIVLADSEFGYVAGRGDTPLQLTEPPDTLNDTTENDGEGQWEEQVSEVAGDSTTEGESTAEGGGEGGEEFSARTQPTEGDASGDAGSTTEDGTVGDLTLEFGTADTGNTEPSDPPVQTISSNDGTDLTGGATATLVRGIGFAGGSTPVTGAGVRNVSTVATDGSGLVAFDGPFAGGTGRYNIGSAQNVNTGDDIGFTGLQWGRWNGGVATVTKDGTSQNITLGADGTPDGQSLHWIMGPAEGEVALPMTGTASYVLVGETNPTDNLGNVGNLGTAALTADFQTGNVTSQVSLGINGQNWNASGTGMINGPADFSGTYSNVTVDGGCAAGGCGGDFDGFFTGGGQGAGMGYSLEDNNTMVSGVAAFEQQ